MTRRGVVLSVQGRELTVLCPGGAVKTVPWRGRMPSVGQEVFIGAARTEQWAGWAAAAAVLLLAAGGIGRALGAGPAAPAVSATAVGVVSVDINPSVELMVSRTGQVVGARAYDAAGRRLLQEDPRLRGEPLVAAVEGIEAWARQHGYLTAAHPVVMLAGWAGSPRSEGTVAGDLRRLMVALQRRAVPGSVLELPLATGTALHASEHAGLSIGRYLLAGMLGKPPAAVAHVPLGQLLQAWPPKAAQPSDEKTAPAAHSDHTGVPRHSASGGAGHAAGAVPGTTAPPKQGTTAKTSVEPPAQAPRTVTGALMGVGPDDVVVSGHAYPLAPSVSITVGGAAVRFSLGRVLGNLEASVVLTLNSAGQVVSIAVKGGPVAGPSAPGLP